MQKKIQTEITKVTLNSPIFTNKSFNPTLVNFIYGTNGTGKSTISRLMDQKDYPGLEFKQPKDDAVIMVYNEDYIRENVQSYGNIPGVFTLTKTNAEKKKEIDDTTAAQKKLQPKMEHAAQDLEKNKGEQTDREKKAIADVWKETTELRKAKYPDTQAGYKNDTKKFFLQLQKTQAVDHDIAELDQLYKTAYQESGTAMPEYKPAHLQFGDDIDNLLGSSIVSVSDTPYASLLKRLGNSDWVRDGHDKYQEAAGDVCPYCGQPLDRHHFEEDLAAVFDKRYEQAVAALSRMCENYRGQLNNAALTLQHNTGFTGPLADEYKSRVDLFMEKAHRNLDAIKAKIAAPATPTTIDNQDLLDALQQVNDTIEKINAEIRKYNDMLSNPKKKQACNQAVWEKMAFQCQTIFAGYSAGMEELKKVQTGIETRQKELAQQDQEYTEKIKELNQQTVNTTVAKDAINALLKSAGFQGFEMVEKPGTQYVYQLVRDDGTGKKTIAKDLSEGERNFIAFLYYYQTVVKSQSDDGIKHHKIVVIDDPVSSMDSGTLYLVASLVRNLISICYNNYDLSEDGNRDDYIKQFFCLTHNPYFFREITYSWQDKYECVSFFQLKKGAGNQSDIYPCVVTIPTTPPTEVNTTPVKNEYDALWKEFLTTDDSMVAMNAARRILEYYFLQVSGKRSLRKLIDEHKESFIEKNDDGSDNTSRYDLAVAMVGCLDTTSAGFNDSLYYDASAVKPDVYREVFKDIFYSLGQDEHYEMMKRRAV
jgi:wobble nucleotide-excising tRNase